MQYVLHVYPPPYFWILHIDGSAMPNPGRMAIGVVLTGPNASHFDLGKALPGTGCNNEAELRALLAGLDLAQQQGAMALRIYTDSQWLVAQLAIPDSGKPLPRPTWRLLPWIEKVKAAVQCFDEVQWRWIPRHCNAQADALAREANLQLIHIREVC